MLVGENSSSSVRTVEAGDTASMIVASTACMVCLKELCLFFGPPSHGGGPGSEPHTLWGCWAHSGMSKHKRAEIAWSYEKTRWVDIRLVPHITLGLRSCLWS